MRPTLLLMTNMKPHRSMLFRLTSRSMSLDNLHLLQLVRILFGILWNFADLGASNS